MIRLGMENPKVLKTCMSAVASLVEEAAFIASPDGLKLRTMDATHTVLLDLDLPACAFSRFEVEKQTTIGVKLAEMNKVLSRAKPNDGMLVEFDEQAGRMAISLSGPPQRRFNVPVIEVESVSYPDPKIAFPATAEVQAGILQDGVKDAELVRASPVKIEIAESGLRMWADGANGSSELRLETASKALANLKVASPTQAGYSPERLGGILSVCAPNDTVGVSLGTDMPIRVDCAVGSGKLRFLLAPIVEAA